MSYPNQETNPPVQQYQQPQQPPAQQPPVQQPPQQRQPVIVHAAPDNQLNALSSQLQNAVDTISGVPERLVQAFREANPPAAPPQQPQQPPQQPPQQQQQQQQQPQQPGTGLSAAQPGGAPGATPGTGASGQPGGEQLPPGMSATRARFLRSFFGRR